MKKAVALTLAAAFFLGVFLFLPRASFADADSCYDYWERCRIRAFAADVGWIKTTLMLTMCDIGLGRCLYLQL